MILQQNNSCLVLIDVQDKLAPHVLNPQSLQTHCAWLLNLATALDVPMIMNMQYPKGLGTTIPSLQPFPYKAVIEKTAFSCCKAEAFVDTLKVLKKNQIVLIGIETHVCILQTALDLIHQGFDIFIVVDAVSARNDLDHRYALKRLKQQGCHLITSEMVFFEWIKDASHPAFKSLSQQFLQGQLNGN
jgi:nicotinamidase-related amidase